MKACGCSGPCTSRCRNDRAAMARVARMQAPSSRITIHGGANVAGGGSGRLQNTPQAAQDSASARPLSRLKPSALKVLGRLQAGPATNADLAQLVGFQYSARIHELRQHGHEITCEALGPTRGIRTYTLEIK